MKTAKKTVTTVELFCPQCGETIPAPEGELFWTVEETGKQNADKCVCPSCKQRFKFPKV